MNDVVKQSKGLRADYGIDQWAFVACWQSSDTVDEVCVKLADLAAKAGRDPMPKPVVLARAASYRSSGIHLKMMKRENGRSLDVKGLNELIEKIDQARSRGEDLSALQNSTTVSSEPAPPETPAPTQKVSEMFRERRRGRNSR